MSELVKKLSKRGSKDLVKKVVNINFKPEELVPIFEILKKRKINLKENGIEEEKFFPKSVKAVLGSGKKTNKSKNSPNRDITSKILKVGQEVEFTTRSKEKRKGKVERIYICGRTKKEYVRLNANGKVSHKRLSFFSN